MGIGQAGPLHCYQWRQSYQNQHETQQFSHCWKTHDNHYSPATNSYFPNDNVYSPADSPIHQLITHIQKLITAIHQLTTHIQELITTIYKLITHIQELITPIHQLITHIQQLLLLLLLLKKIGNAKPGEDPIPIRPISPKTPSLYYQPIEEKKRKGK